MCPLLPPREARIDVRETNWHSLLKDEENMNKNAVILGIAAALAAGSASAELKAFKVNGETVSVAEQKAIYDQAVAQGQPAGADLERQVKNVLINETVLLQEHGARRI